MEPYLQLTNITKTFPGVKALARVDLSAYEGEALALMGANGAGKSTLMNVLGGITKADSGEIRIGARPVRIHDPQDAARHGIAFIHQEMALLPTMSVAENMFITRFPTRAALVDRASIEKAASRVLEQLACSIHPRTRVRDLSPGECQIVEIGRALLTNARIIIFDEPTSSLTKREKEQLFRVIESLKKERKVIIYITHFLDEIFQICDRAEILRNGETVGGGAMSSLTREQIVTLMIGSSTPSLQAAARTGHHGEPVLRVAGLSRVGVLDDIAFTLHAGEILALWGLLGSGRTELARALVGLDSIDQGRIEIAVDGSLRHVSQHQTKQWIGMVTENRREEGLLLPRTVRENLSLANLRALISRVWPFIDGREERRVGEGLVRRLNIKIRDSEQAVGTLSGGNQQKVVLGRWIQRSPRIFIMDEPTRGLDVGAKAEIKRIIAELAAGGMAVLLISSEIEDLIELADRYLVMSGGRVLCEKPGGTSRNELIVAAAIGKGN
jgi:ABC-type sugar transport system ATPase subunit